MLIRGFLLCLAGALLLRLGVTAGERAAIFSALFWQTFPEFARYRLKRLWPVVPTAAGLILLIWGAILLFQGILAYYAARLGHPLR